MKQRMLTVVILAMSACASNEAGRRPAATPDVEPSPISDPKGSEPKTKTTAEPPSTPAVPMQKETPREPTETRSPGAQNMERDAKPEDQGNAHSDLAITQKIRKAVVSDKQLSFAAKNVKIVTDQGQVTLRGDVKTEAERERIELYATQAVGTKRVHSELDVEP